MQKNNFVEGIKEVAQSLISANHPSWRLGQAVFNLLYDLDPATAHKLTGTEVDCFHNDDKIDDFITAFKAASDEESFFDIFDVEFGVKK